MLAKKTMDDEIKEFFNNIIYDSAKAIAYIDSHPDCFSLSYNNFSPFLLACYAGKTDIAAKLFDLDINGDGNTKKAPHSMGPIHLAVARNQVETVRFLIEKGFDIDERCEYGYTAAHIACKEDSYECLDLLIDNNININDAENQFHFTPLHVACYNNHLRIIQLLIFTGADPSQKDIFNNSTVEIASENGHHDLVQILLGKQNDSLFNQCKRYYYKGQYEEMFKLLKQHPMLINYSNKDGFTLLHFILYADIEPYSFVQYRYIVTELISNFNFSLNQKSLNQTKRTPLFYFLIPKRKYYNGLDQLLVDLIQKYHGNPNITTPQNSMLSYTFFHNKHFFRILLQNGADTLQLTKNGQTVLELCAVYSPSDLKEALKYQKYTNDALQSALFTAVEHDNLESFKVLIEYSDHLHIWIKTIKSKYKRSKKIIQYLNKTYK